MKAWIIDDICTVAVESHPLKLVELPKPEPLVEIPLRLTTRFRNKMTSLVY